MPMRCLEREIFALSLHFAWLNKTGSCSSLVKYGPPSSHKINSFSTHISVHLSHLPVTEGGWAMLDEVFFVPHTMSLMSGEFINTSTSLNCVCSSPERQTLSVACKHLVKRLANLSSYFQIFWINENWVKLLEHITSCCYINSGNMLKSAGWEISWVFSLHLGFQSVPVGGTTSTKPGEFSSQHIL